MLEYSGPDRLFSVDIFSHILDSQGRRKLFCSGGGGLNSAAASIQFSHGGGGDVKNAQKFSGALWRAKFKYLTFRA